MGVRGLLTYVKEKGYFVPHELKSTLLIIDGCGAMVDISVFNYYDKRLGGEYRDIYSGAHCIFDIFKKCGITPIVIEDGHAKLEKAETLRRRMENCLESSIEYKQQNYKELEESNVPVLHQWATQTALDDMKICRCRVEFDADEEIMELARKLKCSVAANDSDFCLSDGVDFILWYSIDFDDLLESFGEENEPECGFIKCQRFDRDKFLEDHGISASVLPFLAVLFPSDYSKLALYYKIFPDKARVPPLQKYELALSWLKGKTAEETRNALLLLKPDDRSREDFLGEINFTVNNYTDCAVTVLPVLKENETVCKYLENVQFNEKVSDLNTKYNVPLGFVDRLKNCQISNTFLRFFVSDIFECSVNTHEDVDEKSMHSPTVRLIQGMFGIASKYTEKPSIKLVIREKQRFINLVLKPLTIKNTENFKMLYEIMEIDPDLHTDVLDFDESWTVFILTFIYWRNKCRDIINPTHVHSFLLSVFVLHNRIKIFRPRENVLFPINRFKELQQEDREAFMKIKIQSWTVPDGAILKNILHIHLFLTFQACLLRVMEIFPLLNLPHKIRIHNFLSGELYHSIYTELEGKWNCMRYINNTQFFGSEKLRHLYHSIVSNKIIADLL